jgi:hypothetical protein
VLKTRVLAARALVPLVAPNLYPILLQELVAISALKCTTENYRHGLLLQVINLFFYLVHFLVEDLLASVCPSVLPPAHMNVATQEYQTDVSFVVEIK